MGTRLSKQMIWENAHHKIWGNFFGLEREIQCAKFHFARVAEAGNSLAAAWCFGKLCVGNVSVAFAIPWGVWSICVLQSSESFRTSQLKNVKANLFSYEMLLAPLDITLDSSSSFYAGVILLQLIGISN